MQAHDYVKYADLVAAGLASQMPEMQKAIAEYKAAVAEWDKRNNLAVEQAAVLAARTELDNAKVLFEREKEVFAKKVSEFNARVDKVAAEDKARKEALTAQLKKVEEAVSACERKDAASVAAAATRTLELDKRAVELDQLQAALNTRERDLILREDRLKSVQVTLGKALA